MVCHITFLLVCAVINEIVALFAVPQVIIKCKVFYVFKKKTHREESYKKKFSLTCTRRGKWNSVYVWTLKEEKHDRHTKAPSDCCGYVTFAINVSDCHNFNFWYVVSCKISSFANELNLFSFLNVCIPVTVRTGIKLEIFIFSKVYHAKWSVTYAK